MRSLLAEKTIVIFGLGREGVSTYRFLRQQFPDKEIIITDEKPLTELDQQWTAWLDEGQPVSYSQVDLLPPLHADTIIFRSAGIPRAKVESLFPGAQISSNTQLCFELVADLKREGRQLTVIGITGTKGKSTTSAAIHHVLHENGYPAFLGGNIGKPPLNVLAEALSASSTQPTVLVLELSSHQLSDLPLSPEIAVVQDIVPEHLDYYANFEEYWTAKSQIARHQTDQDLILFNDQSPTATKIAQLSRGTRQGFGDLTVLTELVNPHDLKVVGRHNYLNLLPSILIGRHFRLSDDQIAQALKTFTPLPHRLEKVATVNGVTFINDSLATNPPATIAALEAFAPQPIILIAGGYDRGLDYSELGQAIDTHNLKALILFNPTGAKIKAALTNTSVPVKLVDTMSEAVTEAWQVAEPGDVVLMSPASASFGAFKDYVDRGEQFKNAVKNLG